MLKSGDKLRFTRSCLAMSGVTYKKGDIIELMEPTGQAPYGHLSKVCNWIVKCPHFNPPAPQSVWSSIWICVEYGWLEKV